MEHSVLGSYRMIRLIAEGGMGLVYEGIHELIGQRVAIKVLLPEFSNNTDIIGRFLHEAKVTGQLDHPGIVRTYDYGYTSEGRAFLAMEYLQGETVAQRLDRCKLLTIPEVIRFGHQATGALRAAHRIDVIHRDLKPDNCFLVKDADIDGGERIKILDFGIAKLVDGHLGSNNKTVAGLVLGTPSYMAPEQANNPQAVDHRTDIYSLGAVLYRMACGRDPFERETAYELISAHIREEPAAPRRIRSEISPELERVILRAMSKSPADRFSSMIEMGNAIAAMSQQSGVHLPSASAQMHLVGVGPPVETWAHSTGPSAPTTLNSAVGQNAWLRDQQRRRARRMSVRSALAICIGAAVVSALALFVTGWRPGKTDPRSVAATGVASERAIMQRPDAGVGRAAADANTKNRNADATASADAAASAEPDAAVDARIERAVRPRVSSSRRSVVETTPKERPELQEAEAHWDRGAHTIGCALYTELLESGVSIDKVWERRCSKPTGAPP